MIEIYDNFFSKELVDKFFDLRIKIKINLLRIKNLAPYMKDVKSTKCLVELKEFNKEVTDYMELYKERFHISAIRKNLKKSKLDNEELIKKYKLELEEVRKFKEDNDFPVGAYPLQFNKFSEDLCKDILELERYKKDQEKLIINSIE